MPLTFFRHLLGFRKDKRIISKNVFILSNPCFGQTIISIIVFLPLFTVSSSRNDKDKTFFDQDNRINNSEFTCFSKLKPSQISKPYEQ